jgi:hypothetical protein
MNQIFNVKLFLILLFVSAHLKMDAQVPQKVIVEHFTNSNCSNCANRNPALISNVNNQSDVFMVSIHPSSPYASCLLSQQNKADNDARTNFYGIYGATPRIVVQGNVVSGSSNYGSAAIFTGVLQNTSPFSIRIDQEKFGMDSIRARVVVVTRDTHSFQNLNLFVGLAEDTVFYKGNNGEKEHYNVLRKALSGAQGTGINVSKTIGDSTVIYFSSPSQTIWDFDRIFSFAFLQEPKSLQVLQVENALPSSQTSTTGLRSFEETLFVSVYPNPSKGNVQIALETMEMFSYSIISLKGEILLSGTGIGHAEVQTQTLSPGIYFVEVAAESSVSRLRMIKN